MGKILGISDLPVSTIHTVFEPQYFKRPETYVSKEILFQNDKFVSKEKQNVPNAFVKMRNGSGKLLNHFSKAK